MPYQSVGIDLGPRGVVRFRQVISNWNDLAVLSQRQTIAGKSVARQRLINRIPGCKGAESIRRSPYVHPPLTGILRDEGIPRERIDYFVERHTRDPGR